MGRFGCCLFLLFIKGKRLLVGVEELCCKWSEQPNILSIGWRRFGQESEDSNVDQCKPQVFGFNHVLGRLERLGYRLESKDYMYRLKLAVSKKENL